MDVCRETTAEDTTQTTNELSVKKTTKTDLQVERGTWKQILYLYYEGSYR